MGESTTGQMNQALLEQYEAIGALLVRTATTFATGWYEIGVRVRTVMLNPKAYGTKAVVVLAKALGKKPGALYDAAKVAGTWPEQEFVTLLQRANIYRQPLSFSHFVTLTEAGTSRKKLEDLCLSHGWSVRELRRHLLASSAESGKSARDATKQTTRRISHAADEVERAVALLTTLEPDAVVSQRDALRILRSRVAKALARLDALDAASTSSPRDVAWGGAIPPGEA